MTDKVMFTASELAKRWGFSKDTIRRMVRSGEIRACGFKHIRVPREEVERWEELGDRTMWVRTISDHSTTKRSGNMRPLSGIAEKTENQKDRDLERSLRLRVEERLTSGLLSAALSKKL